MRRFVFAFVAVASLIAVSLSGPATRSTNAAALPSVQRIGSNIRFAPVLIREANKRLRYTIKARYPQVIGARNKSSLAELNRELKQFVVELVSGFKKDFSAPDPPMLSQLSTFDVRYQVELAANNLVSIGFIVNA